VPEKPGRRKNSRGLSEPLFGVSSGTVKEKSNIWLAVALMLAFALTRWPGLLPPNFSAFYALAFCAGVYLPRRLALWLPLTTMAATDLLINLYYRHYKQIDAFDSTQLFNYLVYALIILMGTRFSPKTSWTKLLAGGVVGAVLFYIITNTAAWLFNPFQNPEYTKNLAGWLIALTKGTAGYPPTWEFFRNSLTSGGLFTGLFVGAMKLSEKLEPAEQKEEESVEEPEDAKPEESRA